MSYAAFSAKGKVVSSEQKSTKTGTEFWVLVLAVGTAQYPAEFEATCWRQAAEQAANVALGDEVIVSGTLKSPLNDNGYRNTRVSANTVLPAVVEQTAVSAAPAPAAVPAEVFDDLPF